MIICLPQCINTTDGEWWTDNPLSSLGTQIFMSVFYLLKVDNVYNNDDYLVTRQLEQKNMILKII